MFDYFWRWQALCVAWKCLWNRFFLRLIPFFAYFDLLCGIFLPFFFSYFLFWFFRYLFPDPFIIFFSFLFTFCFLDIFFLIFPPPSLFHSSIFLFHHVQFSLIHNVFLPCYTSFVFLYILHLLFYKRGSWKSFLHTKNNELHMTNIHDVSEVLFDF